MFIGESSVVVIDAVYKVDSCLRKKKTTTPTNKTYKGERLSKVSFF